MGAIVPAAHGVGEAEPVAHELPAGHGAHSAAAARSVALEYEPAGHGSTALAPSGQKPPPPLHGRHSVWPLLG